MSGVELESALSLVARWRKEFGVICADRVVADIAQSLAEQRIALVDTPEMLDFLDGVKREAAHQVARWGAAHDRDKSAENWFWLVGYLAGKALRSAITGDSEKALHHTISSAAALYNWHTAIKADATGAGIGADADLARKEPA